MPRLFFALQPDSKARDAIAAIAVDIARRHGGRPVPAPKIHLTLAFLGEVEASRIDLTRIAGSAAGAFELSMDRIGSFARQALAWVAPSRMPSELTILHEGLTTRLRDAGFVLERRRFSPHITIVRRIERPVVPAEMRGSYLKSTSSGWGPPSLKGAPTSWGPPAWSVREFVLVESDLATGAYRDLARWPLPAGDEGNRAS